MHTLPARRLLLLVTGSSIMLLGACSQEAIAPPPAPEVEIVTIKSQPDTMVIELPGRVQAVRTAEVRSRVDGIVQRRLFEEGTDVRAGQALFAIDPRELRANLSAFQASLARAQANAANAQQDVDRYRSLLVDQAISKQENDAAVARLRSAQADIAEARAQVERASLSLGYTTVTAPISGRASRAQVTEGALVSAAGGTLLTTIEQLNPIYVNFGQSSSEMIAIRRDMASGRLDVPDRPAVQLELEDGTAYGPAGQVRFADLAFNETTGTAALRAQFPNPDEILLPGQFVRARIKVGTRADAIFVPQRAVTVRPQGGTVMVVDAKGLVEVRQIRLGDLQGSSWRVLDGLKPEDRVIVSGLQKVQAGQMVRVATAPAVPQPTAKQPTPAR